MREHWVSATVCAWTSKHNALGTETAMHFKLFLLALDHSNHIAAKKHFHFCIAVLKELFWCYLSFVAEMVHLEEQKSKLETIRLLANSCLFSLDNSFISMCLASSGWDSSSARLYSVQLVLGLNSLAAESDPLKIKLRVTTKDYDTKWYENWVDKKNACEPKSSDTGSTQVFSFCI